MTTGPEEYVVLPGSNRRAPEGGQPRGRAEPHDRIEVTVLLRRRNPLPAAAQRPRMTRSDLARKHGACEPDIRRIREFAARYGLIVSGQDQASRRVVLTGTIAAFSTAFKTQLMLHEYGGRVYRTRSGPLHVPADVVDILEGVFGLDNRPQAEPRFVRPAAGSAVSAFSPTQIAKFYDFPTGLDGRGQTIGIIELGGGWKQEDIDAYFGALGLQAPEVTTISVDGGANAPTGDTNGPDTEVMLDIEVAGAVAPAARIAVYFAPNSDQGFIDAVLAAIHDETYHPLVISISWGNSESRWTEQAMTSFDQALQDAGILGVTVCVASGDAGSSDGQDDGRAHVDFPASSPHALACGGTRLNSADGSTVDSEVAWHNGSSASGGGVSETFALPDWQRGVGVPLSVNPSQLAGRGVPDVAGNADQATGYQVRADGEDFTVGGTSAVAPLWAGLVALINQAIGWDSAGFLNPLLYGDPTIEQDFRDITDGDNGAYQAGQGWDACTGWGSPDGKGLLNGIATWIYAEVEPNVS